jgi:hypothetical protein
MSDPKPPTDDSQLAATGTISISPDGRTTDEAFPKPGVEYDFCVNIVNPGKLPTGPFFVRFNLSGDQDPPLDLDFQQDAGLEAAATVQAVVHLGKFPNQFASYELTACVYSSSAPDKAIHCAGDYGFTVNTQSASDSADGGN